jgi:hypothetical protein
MNDEMENATRGAEALATLKNREVGNAPDGLFDQLISETVLPQNAHRNTTRFWLGTGFGAAVAASIFAIAVTFGWFGEQSAGEVDSAQFQIALHEPREMDIAIETDKALKGATISISLAGNVEISGFAGQRELTWAEDLDAGINRLSLPLIATGEDGGQVVVRLSHPKSERVFIVNLRTEV